MSRNQKHNRNLSLALVAFSLAGLVGCQPATTSPLGAPPTPTALTPPPTAISSAPPAEPERSTEQKPRNVRIEGGVAYYYSDGAFPREAYTLPFGDIEAAWDGRRTPPPNFQVCPQAKYQIQAVEKTVYEQREEDPYTYWGEDEKGDPAYLVWCKIPGARWFRAEQHISPEWPLNKRNGRKDVSDIRVVVPEAETWSISVDGYGRTSLSGTGPSLSEKWDGTVNGGSRPLPDGEYSLRLRVNNDSRMDQTAKVIIDTKPPAVSESHVYAIENKDESDNLDYTIRFKLADPRAADGTHAGLKEGTAKLDKVNVPYELKGRLMRLPPEPKTYAVQQGSAPASGTQDEPEAYELVAKVPMGATDDERYDKFEYQIYAEDWAGNRAEEKTTLETATAFAGMPTDPVQVCGEGPARAFVAGGSGVAAPPGAGTVAGTAAAGVALGGGALIVSAVVVGVKGAVLVGDTAGFASKVMLDLGDEFRERCIVPADDSYDKTEVDIQELRRRTPFLCPQGAPLNYPFALWVAKTDLTPVAKVPPIVKLALPVTVTIEGENLAGRLVNKEVWCRQFYTITNLGQLPKFSWDGRRRDVFSKPTDPGNDGKLAPSGNYKVTLQFGRGARFMSPNQKQLRAAGMKTPADVTQRTLVGFRVINNEDVSRFGPQGNAKHAISEDEDNHPGEQDRPKDPGFAAWTSYIGPAGVGKPPRAGVSTHEWHHVVEQYQNQFEYGELNRPYNLIRIPHDLHRMISTAYGQPQLEVYRKYGDSKNDPPDYRRLPLRDWLKIKDIKFDTQRQIGIEMMRQVCRNTQYPNGYEFKHQTSVR